MKKMPSLFVRDHSQKGAPYIDQVTPGCEWVIAGEGVATRKYDGTCCLVRDGVLYRRYDAKHGKTPPEGFEPCQEEADPVTGHWPGWLKVGDEPESEWHREAWNDPERPPMPDGTYELIGPRINGNREQIDVHAFAQHGAHIMRPELRSFTGLGQYMAARDIEGIVFHHTDGRMVKCTKQGFGMRRKP